MGMNLRQSTASQEVQLGPFLDSTDGNTEKTGLTIAASDIRIWKTGATSVVAKNSGGATHMEHGNYVATLDATDTATVGPIIITVHVTGALRVVHVFDVLPAAVYDAWYGGTGLLVQVTSVSTAGGQAIADAVLDRAIAEPTGVFAWPASLRTIIQFLGALSRNRLLHTASLATLRNDANSATISTAAMSDDGTTVERSEWA